MPPAEARITARPRVVVTGIGSVSALGVAGGAALGDALARGVSGIGPVRSFPTGRCWSRLGGEAGDGLHRRDFREAVLQQVQVGVAARVEREQHQRQREPRSREETADRECIRHGRACKVQPRGLSVSSEVASSSVTSSPDSSAGCAVAALFDVAVPMR